MIARRRGSGYWPQSWPDPVACSARTCTVPHVSALHGSTLDGMKSLIDWAVTAALVLLAAFGLFVAISGFVQSGPGWAVVGLLILVFACCLEQWLHRVPSVDELMVYDDADDATEV